jgi:hypothetical protein
MECLLDGGAYAVDQSISLLLKEQKFNSKCPLVLREAAEICNVEVLWLRERVTRKEITAYRNGLRGAWRVFPSDVRDYLMASNNQKISRRRCLIAQTK